MAFRDRIEVVIDFVTTGAQTGLQKLRTDVAAADTATGKAKAGITAMGGALQQYGAQAALAAGAALVTFGAKSVQAFTDSALAAGKFADATGLTTEDASRLIEVAGDLGVSAEAVQASIQRVNNAAAKGDLAKFGIEMGVAEDGAYDANQTFLNTIEAIGGIASAAEREAAARKLMGRSWAELAELATMSAEDLRDALANVSDEKLFDESEVRQAREYRAAMDQLKDAVEDVTLAAGKGLTPVITDLAEGISNLSDTLGGGGAGGAIGTVMDFINPIDNVSESIKDLTDGTASFGDYLRSVGSVLPGFGEGLDRLTDKNDILTGTAESVAEKLAEQKREAELLADETEDLTVATDAAAESTEAAAKTHEDLTAALKDQYDAVRDATDATIAYEDSVIDLESSMDDYRQSLVEANADGEVTREELLNLAGAHNDLKGDVLDSAEAFALAQGATEGSTEAAKLQIEELQRLKLKFPELAPFIDGHIAKLNAIPTNIVTTLTVQNPTGYDELDVINGLTGGKKAGGLVNNAIMAANGITQAAIDWWTGGRGGSGSGSTEAEKQRQKFDREFAAAKVRYERGTFTADAYLAELRRLQAAYKWGKHSEPGMALWREIQRVNKEIKEAAAELVKDNDGSGRDPWQQAAANQAAVEASQNLASTAASSMADLTDRDPNNDASALDAWAAAIWRDIEARADRKFDVKGRRWADFARKQLERAITANPPLASRLRVYLLGIPSFGGGGGDDGGPGGPATTVRPPRGNGAVAGTSRMAGGTGSAGGSGGVTVVLNAPKALMVDRRALDEFAQMVTPAVMRETKRIRNGAG